MQFAKYLFPFITVPYLTRALGPDVYAIRAYVLATMSLIQVFLDYGFLAYGTKRIAESGSDTEVAQLASSAITYLRVVLCAMGACVVLVLVETIPLLAANRAYVAIAYIGTCCKATLPDYIFQGQEDMGIITRRFVGSQAVAVVLIFAFVRSADDILLVPLFEGIAALIALFWSWLNVVAVRGIRFCRVPLSEMIGVFSSSTVFFVSAAATTLYSSLTTLLIGLFVPDAAQVSYWSISISLIAALQSMFSPLSNSLYPYMCANRDFALVKRYLIFGIPVIAVATVCLFAFSDAAMLVVGGSEYTDGAAVLALLSPVLFLSYPAIILGFPVLAAFDRTKKLTASSTVAAIFHVVGLGVLLLAGQFSIPAVAILRCFTEAILLGVRAGFVCALYKEVLAA